MPEQQEASKLLLRLPVQLRERIEAVADRDYRSLTGEILYLLEHALESEAERTEAASGTRPASR